jgi:hypothetical protein
MFSRSNAAAVAASTGDTPGRCACGDTASSRAFAASNALRSRGRSGKRRTVTPASRALPGRW